MNINDQLKAMKAGGNIHAESEPGDSGAPDSMEPPGEFNLAMQAPESQVNNDPSATTEGSQAEPQKQQQQHANGVDGVPIPDRVEALPAQNTDGNPPQAPAKPLFEGLRNINDPQKLAEYTRDLESRLVNVEANQHNQSTLASQMNAQTATPMESEVTHSRPQALPVSGDDSERTSAYRELLFTDPDRAIAQIQEDARKDSQKAVDQLRTEINQDSAQKDFWESFYSSNPDLKNADKVVKLTLNERWNELQSLDPKTASDKLAQISRQEVATLVEGIAPVEQVNSRPAITLGASGDSVPKPASKPAAKVSFSDQIRGYQEKKRPTIYKTPNFGG